MRKELDTVCSLTSSVVQDPIFDDAFLKIFIKELTLWCKEWIVCKALAVQVSLEVTSADFPLGMAWAVVFIFSPSRHKQGCHLHCSDMIGVEIQFTIWKLTQTVYPLCFEKVVSNERDVDRLSNTMCETVVWTISDSLSHPIRLVVDAVLLVDIIEAEVFLIDVIPHLLQVGKGVLCVR